MGHDMTMENLYLLAPLVGGLIVYFIRLEGKLAQIGNDLCWVKKVLDSRQKRREEGE